MVIKTLLQEYVPIFWANERSRLVFRVLTSVSSYEEMEALLVDYPDMEMDMYPDALGRFYYLTLGLNKPERALSREHIVRIQDAVRGSIDRTRQHIGSSFEAFALAQLCCLDEQEVHFALGAEPGELFDLWETFGWSFAGCDQFLQQQESANRQQFLGLRDDRDRLVAAAMSSDQSHQVDEIGLVHHVETTEWAVLPSHRALKLSTPLLIGFHAMLLEQGDQNIFADLRAPDPLRAGPHSVSPAIRSGMTVVMPGTGNTRTYTSVNHVAIGGKPDTTNIARFADRPSPSEHHDFAMRDLRSFVRGYVVPELFTPALRDAYLTRINLP